MGGAAQARGQIRQEHEDSEPRGATAVGAALLQVSAPERHATHEQQDPEADAQGGGGLLPAGLRLDLRWCRLGPRPDDPEPGDAPAIGRGFHCGVAAVKVPWSRPAASKSVSQDGVEVIAGAAEAGAVSGGTLRSSVRRPWPSSVTRCMPAAVTGGSSGSTRPLNMLTATSSFGLVRYQNVIGDGRPLRTSSHQLFGPLRS